MEETFITHIKKIKVKMNYEMINKKTYLFP